MHLKIFNPKGFSWQIDKADFALVNQMRWHIDRSKNQGYMKHTAGRKILRMHRLIMNANQAQFIDHINGDRADNRRCNLRFATAAQNIANSKKRSNTKTPYKGVVKNGDGKLWTARICKNGKIYGLGSFETPEKAALAYNAKALELHGEFARINEGLK